MFEFTKDGYAMTLGFIASFLVINIFLDLILRIFSAIKISKGKKAYFVESIVCDWAVYFKPHYKEDIEPILICVVNSRNIAEKVCKLLNNDSNRGF